jgi:hypothetical protein
MAFDGEPTVRPPHRAAVGEFVPNGRGVPNNPAIIVILAALAAKTAGAFFIGWASINVGSTTTKTFRRLAFFKRVATSRLFFASKITVDLFGYVLTFEHGTLFFLEATIELLVRKLGESLEGWAK